MLKTIKLKTILNIKENVFMVIDLLSNLLYIIKVKDSAICNE